MATNNPKKVRLGICMAGAVSAGAYTAGVMDYLVETLERWEQKKNEIKAKKKRGEQLSARDELIPTHDVIIEVLSGASAGGMSAAILAYSFNDNTHISKRNNKLIEENYGVPQPTDKPSKLYDCWINMVDEKDNSTFKKLMNTDDVVAIGKMKAILNSKPIDDIALKAIPEKIAFNPPGYISEFLSIILSVTNLEGVPIDIRFSNVEAKNPTRNVLRMHSGFLHYQFNAQFVAIDFPPEIVSEAAKDHLAAAAKATGAFPFGLANRRIMVNQLYFAEYTKRLKDNYKIEVNVNLNGDENYVFNAVDGGTINNEPFGTAVKILESKKKLYHAADENYMILIDPFPTVTNAHKEAVYKAPGEYTLLQQFFKIIGAIRNQSMFKQEDLLNGLEMDKNRFLIYPAKRKYYFLASGAVEGFAGFLKKEFRQHDYQLGRKNCQDFLRYYFGETVERFEAVTGTTVTNEQKKTWAYDVNYQQTGTTPLLKIPLIPDMLLLQEPKPEIETPEYNGLTVKDLNELLGYITVRVEKLVDSSYASLSDAGKGISSVVGLAMRWFPGFFKKKVVNAVIPKARSYMEKTFLPQSIKQAVLVSNYIPIITKHGEEYKKFAGVFARVSAGGENIKAVTGDGEESEVITSKGDYVAINDTKARETYVIKPGKFHDRYVHVKDNYFKPNENARVIALQVTELNIYQLRLDELEDAATNADRLIYIEAPWKQSQKLRLNDYLVCPPNKSEVYRIAKAEFLETYTKME